MTFFGYIEGCLLNQIGLSYMLLGDIFLLLNYLNYRVNFPVVKLPELQSECCH